MDRFDLESRITELYSLIDSLNDISYGILESDLSRDETVNAIDGLAVVTKLKLEKLFDTFIQVHNLDKYNGIGNVSSDYTGCSEPEAYACGGHKQHDYTHVTNTTDWL